MYQHNIFLIITFKDIQKLRNPYLYTLKIEYVDTFFYFYFFLFFVRYGIVTAT